MNGKIKRMTWGAALLCVGGSLHVGTCAHNENFFEFRATAGPGLESGVQALLDGDATGVNTIMDSVVEGLFEMWAPDTATGRPHR